MALAADEALVLAARRERLRTALDGGVLLLAAAPERRRSADVTYPYRQDSDFDWLTGFPEPEAVAVLAASAEKPYTLFVRPRDPERALWVGPRAGVEGAVADWGADAAFPVGDLDTELPKLLAEAPHVTLHLDREDALVQRLLGVVRKVHAERPRAGSGPTAIRDAGALLHELRLRKDAFELGRMRQAIAIACEAHRVAMRAARPGMFEYELEALLDYTFRSRGATGWAYPTIVASGPNATVLHYTANSRRLGADDLVLVDAGAEYRGYCADVTRTFPAGPRFSSPQRDLYEAVVTAQLAAIGEVRPGVTLDAVHDRTVRVLADALLALGLLAGTVDEVIEKETYKRFFMHRTSHWLGHDVHDVGRYKVDGAARPLEPGMVCTIEPGLYVAADAPDVPAAFRGTGIRVEDDVLVTAEGSEVLSAAAPKLAAEIEALRADGPPRLPA